LIEEPKERRTKEMQRKVIRSMQYTVSRINLQQYGWNISYDLLGLYRILCLTQTITTTSD
jgi:hypothetical protein